MIKYLRGIVNPITIAWAACGVAYWAATLLFDSRVLIIVMDALAIASSVAVVVQYFRAMMIGLSNRRMNVFIFLIAGIWLAWFTNAGDRTMRVYIRITQNPEILDSPLIGGFLATLTFAACLHLMVGGDRSQKSGRVDAGAAKRVAFTILGGLALAGAILWCAAAAGYPPPH